MDFRNKKYLTEDLPNLLKTLEIDRTPNFGIMTPHHMIEHLIWTAKMFMRQTGEAGIEPSKSEISFQKFVANGCPFQYRPKPNATLKDLKYSTIEEAIQVFEDTNRKFYSLAETKPDYKSYNPMTGAFNIAQLDVLLGQHARWHAYQFGLADDYKPVTGV